jgi:membrane protein required for colicin V production
MNWVDVILLGVIALSAILAFFHGLVREALGVAGWVGAAVVALLARKEIQPFLDPYFTPPWLAEAIGAGVVFLVALIVFKLMINAVADRVQDSALGGIDRVLGLVFGAARGAFCWWSPISSPGYCCREIAGRSRCLKPAPCRFCRKARIW